MNELWRCIEGEYEEEEIVRVKKSSKQQKKNIFKKGQNR
jgi:hypothetical protein